MVVSGSEIEAAALEKWVGLALGLLTLPYGSDRPLGLLACLFLTWQLYDRKLYNHRVESLTGCHRDAYYVICGSTVYRIYL